MAVISAANIVTWNTTRYASKILIDLTNQFSEGATSITNAIMTAAAEDAIELFESAVGDEPYDDYKHDKGACKALGMVFLYIFAENSAYASFHLSNAQQFLRIALRNRYYGTLTSLSEQEQQQYTQHESFIETLPTSLRIS